MPFIDARKTDANTVVHADVCIVGAGAAGITLAKEFAGQHFRVLLLESGDVSFRHRPQLLYLGEDIGVENGSTATSRFRMFGGSTTRWAGQCRPLDAIDFEQRESIPHSGWPFDRQDLDPYYRRAHAIASLGPFDYDPSTWSSEAHGPLPADSELLETIIYQFGFPTDFGQLYRDDLQAAENVHVYLNANVVEIEADADNHGVTGLRVATFNGRRMRIEARHYVLACGGIENARLLLASNRVFNQGLGNEHDLVGRFFMDHAYFVMGYFQPAKPEYDQNYYVIEDYALMGSEQKICAGFALNERVRRNEALNGAAIYFNRRPRYKALPEYYSRGVKSFIHLVDVLRHTQLPNRHFGRHLCNALVGFRDVEKTLRRQLVDPWNPQPKQCLKAVIEATPDPESRVTLGERKDHFGMPRVRVDWRIEPSDKRGLNQLLAAMRHEFPRLGLGRLVENPSEDEAGWPMSMTGGKHHMGTTRMHVDPHRGVVDPSCRVHGLSNLYVAGSSVFVTAGYANPTLTIIALAIRLADHLKARMNP